MPDVVVVDKREQFGAAAFGNESSSVTACSNPIDESWIDADVAMDVEQFELHDLSVHIEPYLRHLCECPNTGLKGRRGGEPFRANDRDVSRGAQRVSPSNHMSIGSRIWKPRWFTLSSSTTASTSERSEA